MAKHMKSARTAAAARASDDQGAGAAADAPAVEEHPLNPPSDFDEEDFFGHGGAGEAPEAAPAAPRRPEAA
eukprot:4001480-Pyramimonas_sp.AAC.1